MEMVGIAVSGAAVNEKDSLRQTHDIPQPMGGKTEYGKK
jgi:hypothetical protein